MTVGSVIMGGSLDTDIPEIEVEITRGRRQADAKDLVNDFFENINHKNETINTFILSSYLDNVVHGFSVWRYLYDSDSEFGFDVSRLDPRTLRIVEETSHGYMWIVQRASQHVRTKKDFFGHLPWWGAYREGTIIWMKYDRNYINFMRLFPHQPPPSVPLMPVILHKQALIYYIHLSANTSLNPMKVMKIGDTQSNIMPQSKPQWEHDFEEAERILRENASGDYIIPGYWDLDSGKSQRAKMDDLVKELNYYDELIGIGVGLPLGLLRQTGVRLSTDSVLQTVWLQRIQSLRRTYRSSLKSMLELGLLPANGFSGYKVKLNFPPLSAGGALDKAKTALTLAQAGMWSSGAEARKWLKTAIEQMSDHDQKVPYDDGQIAGLAPKEGPAKPQGQKPEGNPASAE